LWLTAKIRRLELDRHLVNLAPGPLSALWQKFQPSGRVHVDATLEFDGQDWTPDVSIECLDAAFSYHKFPYRLAECTGRATLADDTLEANLTAYADSRPVRIACRLSDPAGTPYGWVEASCDNVPFDQKLYGAMTDQARSAVRSFRPQGTMNCYYRSWRDGPQSPPHRRLVATLNRVRVEHDKFPYPMSNVRGTLEMLDDHWTCRDAEGTNDTAVVACNGQWTCGPSGGSLALNLTGKNVPLEEELRDALSEPDMRKLWDELRLQGMVDLDVRISREHAGQRPTVAVDAVPHADKTSIEPTFFP